MTEFENVVKRIFTKNPDIGRVALRKKLAKLGYNVSEMESRFICKQQKEGEEKDIKNTLPDETTLIDIIQSKGYFVTKQAKQENYTFKLDIAPVCSDFYKIGIVSDTQIGSKFQQITHLDTFYQVCEACGVTTVFHCGDILDGEKVYKGQEYELFLHGADAQVDYCVKNYPSIEGITTYFICGNHDESLWKHGGIDIGKRISEKRKDMVYKGFHGAFFGTDSIENLIYLHHGAGGISYARSYRLQKLIEQIAPERKPYFLLEGHFHVSCYLPAYRNVGALLLPCFQSQTPYLTRKGLYPEIGGVIMSFSIGELNLPSKASIDFITFKEPIEEDF